MQSILANPAEGFYDHLQTLPHRVLVATRESLAALCVFTLLGALVVGPLLGHWVLLLDWVNGPHVRIPRGVWGLDFDQFSNVPFRFGVALLRDLVGAKPVGWLLPLSVFPIAGTGAWRLLAGRSAGAWAAGGLYAVNPFVLERLRAGHIPFLLGYALLPWAVSTFLHSTERSLWWSARSAAWVGVLASLSPHYGFIAGISLVGANLVHWRVRSIWRVSTAMVAASLTSLYVGIIYLTGTHLYKGSIGDLQAFRTHGSSVGDMYLHLVGMEGFWRTGPGLPSQVLGGAWPVALLILLGAVGYGIYSQRSQPLALALLVPGVVGLVLAAGDRGPSGGMFHWMYLHVPLFNVMREPQKFLCLWVLLLAVGFGWAADACILALKRWEQKRPSRAKVSILRWAAILLLVCLPGGYTSGIFWGVQGQLQGSTYPQAWQQADQLMGSGEGKVLFLPWHQYQSFSFTGGRTVATPAGSFFRREVISGDNIEVGPVSTDSTSRRSDYLEELFARAGEIHRFGRLVAPLGVQYVLLSAGEAQQYGWVAKQEDLKLVLSTPQLSLWENTASGVGRVGSVRVVSGVDQLIDLANSGELGSEAVIVGSGAGNPAGPFSQATSVLTHTSPVTYHLPAGAAGWVVVPEPFQGGWRVGGHPLYQTISGVLAYPVGATPQVVGFRSWRFLRLGYAVSGLALLVLVLAGLAETRPVCRRNAGSSSEG